MAFPLLQREILHQPQLYRGSWIPGRATPDCDPVCPE